MIQEHLHQLLILIHLLSTISSVLHIVFAFGALSERLVALDAQLGFFAPDAFVAILIEFNDAVAASALEEGLPREFCSIAYWTEPPCFGVTIRTKFNGA